MEPIKVLYTIYIKNPRRPSAHYYARVREKGQPLYDIDLKTKDRAQAEAWLRLRRNELDTVNAKIMLGEPVSEEQLRSLTRWQNRRHDPKEAPKVPTVMEAVDEFERHVRRTGRRESTVHTYLRAVKALLGPFYHDPVTCITEDLILDRMAAFDQRKANTRKNYSVTMHELAKFIVDRYDMPPKLVNAIPRIKVSQEDRVHWDMMEMRSIIDSVVCKDKKQEEQYKAYFWVLATSGARQGETAALLWTDFKDGVVTFRASVTKTRTERKVPLFYHTAHMVYSLRRKDHGEKIFDLLPESQAARFRVLRAAIKRANENRSAMAQIPMGGLHTFRHSVSVLLYRDRDGQRPDLKVLCTMMGHSPQTALTYYQGSRSTDDVRELVNDIYSQEHGVRGPMDDMIDAGLI